MIMAATSSSLWRENLFFLLKKGPSAYWPDDSDEKSWRFFCPHIGTSFFERLFHLFNSNHCRIIIDCVYLSKIAKSFCDFAYPFKPYQGFFPNIISLHIECCSGAKRLFCFEGRTCYEEQRVRTNAHNQKLDSRPVHSAHGVNLSLEKNRGPKDQALSCPLKGFNTLSHLRLRIKVSGVGCLKGKEKPLSLNDHIWNFRLCWNLNTETWNHLYGQSRWTLNWPWVPGLRAWIYNTATKSAPP